jgi:hypothetical protein
VEQAKGNMWKLSRVTGDGCRHILRKFKFADHLPSECSESAQEYQTMWDDFRDIYDNINTETPWTAQKTKDKILSWFSTTLDGLCDGKGKLPRCKPLVTASYLLTPYFHCLSCHIAQMIKHSGEIYSFSGQGFEKCNHVHQRMQQISGNRRGEDCGSVGCHHEPGHTLGLDRGHGLRLPRLRHVLHLPGELA